MIKDWEKRKRNRRQSVLGKKKRYTSDLTEGQWRVIAPLIPPAKPGGRPRTSNMREVLNGIFYRLKNGCSWENLPKDFPPHKTVSRYHREWTLGGTIEKIHAVLRGMVRKQAGKTETPTAGIIDSQSVETTEKGGTVAMMPVKKSRVVNGTSW
jgi:putative transposase